MAFVSAVMAVCAVQFAVAQAPAGWKTFSPDHGKFSVSLPAVPTTETQKLDGASMATYTSDSDDAFISISELVIDSDEMTDAERGALFEDYRKGLTDGFKSSFEESGTKLELKFGAKKAINVGVLKGFDQEVQLGQFKISTRLLATKGRVIMFFSMPMADPNASTVMFKSFRYSG